MARIIGFRRINKRDLGTFLNPSSYSSTGASTGQTPAQVPHDMHAD